MDLSFQDRIANLCIRHFNSLPKTGKPNVSEWTVLSCIVRCNVTTDHCEVVALGTGTKCIGKLKMSRQGDILNDSHAEIVCRRAFLRYIYNEINAGFSETFAFDADVSKYYLKDVVEFHFFTSHMPCGDAAIFPKQDQSEFGQVLLSSAKKRPADYDLNCKTKKLRVNCDMDDSSSYDEDIFRTGAKCLPNEPRQDLCGAGVDYHMLGVVRTKPGRGDPTLSVSCSDKIAKWCCMGVQGAALSLLLKEPIYLSSFIVAGQTSYSEQALTRAFFQRFDTLTLKWPYNVNKMKLLQASVCFEHHKVESKQPCPSSIVWAKIGTQPLEVAVEGKKQGVTKKRQNTKVGRLQISKIELLRVFIATARRLQLSLFDVMSLNRITYVEVKAKAKEYQEMWQVVKQQGFKTWTIKDNLLRFTVD